MECASRNALRVYDEFAYFFPGDDGKPWRRNVMTTMPRNSEVSDEHTSLFTHVGYGFSVFNLGKTEVPRDSEGEVADQMAGALPEGCAQSTSACLVQVSRPRLSAREQRDTIPTLLLVVWGRSPGAADASQTQNTGALTYEQFAMHPSVKQKMQASSKYRAQIAASLLDATRLKPNADVYNGDRSQLYSWMDTVTCRVDVHEQCVALVNDYNTTGQNSACVAHGPSRGLTLYTQRTHSASQSGSLTVERGAPTSDTINLLPGIQSDSRDMISQSEMIEALENCVQFDDTPPRVQDHVRVGGHITGCTKFSTFAVYDEYYTPINALLYSSAFTGCASICCSSVASVVPSPVRTCGGKIYGCVEHTLSAIQRHAEVTETHITVPNSQEWREALIAISPGKAAFVFMNEKTANMDTVTGDINNYRISRKEIAEKAI
jgi:hypothetical protein